MIATVGNPAKQDETPVETPTKPSKQSGDETERKVLLTEQDFEVSIVHLYLVGVV